jgi:hypothetical protein
MIWFLVGFVCFFLIWALIRGDDPKFGYHYLWIDPIVLVIAPFLFLIEGIYIFTKWLKMRWIYFRNPKTEELVKLSGVKK